MMIAQFPYPAKKPGGCRFDGFPDYTNYQDYGEEEVEVNDNDFKFWEMIREDPDSVALSRVGMDKQNRCLLSRKHHVPKQPYGSDWKDRYFLIKRNIMASFLALAVIEGHRSYSGYKQMLDRFDHLVPPTGDPVVDGCPTLTLTQEGYDRLNREKQEKERMELEERKKRCADFWDKDVWVDEECRLFFEGDEPVLISHGKRFTFGHDGHEPMTIIYGDGARYLHNGFDVADECRYFLKNPQGKTQSITGKQYDAERFCHLLFAAATFNSESVSIDEVEARLERMFVQKHRAATRKAEVTHNESRNKETQFPSPNPQPTMFPYPAKRPGGCRFPASGDNANFQDYGEEPVTMSEKDFESWWFFYEDPDKPCMSHVGMDKQNRCILERRYGHGDLSHWTVEKRFFLIKRNVMASCLALAMIENVLERNDYWELTARLDRLVPPTGNPAVDGCTPLVPPQELLDRKSESEIKAEKKEKVRQFLNGKVVWQDEQRKLYFEETAPILIYKGERYTFSCHPYEPMAIILRDGEAVAHIHNAFYPDECKNFIENRDYQVRTITGRHHNAERFCRLLTTAVDSFYDCQIDEVENKMQKELVKEKGVNAIQFDPCDFECEKVLYEGIPLLLGYFERMLSREFHVGKIYSIAFGYPGRNKDEYEYYLLSEQEYHEFEAWPEKRQWKDTAEASAWMHKNLEGKKQLLCNDFSRNPTIYKPFFTLGEIPGFKSQESTPLPPTEPTPPPPVTPTPPVKPAPLNKPTPPVTAEKGFKFTLSKEFNQRHSSPSFPTADRIQIKYSRVSVCAADDYVNRDLTIKMPGNATVGDLVDYIRHYNDGQSYTAIPYTGGGNWWNLESDKGTLAQVNDDHNDVCYKMNPSTPLKSLGITEVKGTRG